MSMPIQVADVKRAFGSARELVDACNRIVFDKGANGKCISYPECQATGVKTAIHERNGTFQFDIEAPRRKGGGVEEARSQETARTEGFTRQGTFMADLFYLIRYRP